MKVKYFPLYISLLGLISVSKAQNRRINREISVETLSNSEWKFKKDAILTHVTKRNIGPAATSGRITAIAVPHKNLYNKPDRNTVYIGAASGGIWKSENGGLSWKPIFDKMDVQSIGALAINPQNPDEIWAGTGEGNPRNSHNSGKGIYRSLDGGKTWKCMGLEATRNIHRIVINPNNPKQLFVAAFGSIWGSHPERGVYRSNDGGENWERVLFNNNSTGCAELIMDPQNPQKLFAALYDFERKPWTFRSGGSGSGLHVTYDGGNTWKRLSSDNGLPKGELGRIGLAIPKSNTKRVYAIIEANKSGFYRSNDGGEHWQFVTDHENAGNRPFYYHEIYAHPEIEDRVYSIWSQVSYSRDAGEHWDILANWGTIHPDHQAFLIHPEDPDYIINGNDGGIAISYDGGKTWRFAENIPVGQFYHIDVDNQVPYNVYGGLQDNGSWIGPAFHWKNGPIKNHEWQEVLFGDGFDVAPIPNKPGEGYAMWQGGNVYHYNVNTHQNEPIKPQHPEGKHLRFNWNAGMSVDPHNPNGLYFGSQYLHYSTDNGKSWKIISPDLTTNDSSKLHQAKSGGLTVDATGAENYCSIISIGVAGKVKDIIWIGTDDGNIQRTTNGGKDWELVSKNIKGLPANAWIPYLWVSADGSECWAVANNYRQNDWKSYLFVSTDGGKNWKNTTENDNIQFEGIHQEMGYVRCVLPSPNDKNLVFLGSDRGLWVSFNRGQKWHKWTQGFPSVPVSDLKINNQFQDLIVGTFGRGVWVFDDIRPLYKLCHPISDFKIPLEIEHTSKGYLANFMSNSGQHYQTADLFGAPNKNTDVRIHMFIDSHLISPKNKIKLVGEIYDSNNQRIRKHHFAFDTAGYHVINWRMIRDGVRFPSHGNTQKDSTLPAGMKVAPGTYKIVIRNEGDTLKFNTMVACDVVNSNQTEWDNNAYQEKLKYDSILNVSISKAYWAFESLKTAQENLKTIQNLHFNTDGIKKETLEEAKRLLKEIEALKLQFMLPEGYRYYEESTVRLNDVLHDAHGLLHQTSKVTENGKVAILNAQRASSKLCDEIDLFMNKKCNPFIEKLASYPSEIRWVKPINK